MTVTSATRPLRVMVVDDSVVVRGLFGRWISAMAGFEVVATAPNGRIAVERLQEANPDIVLLDLDMPEVDGLAALPAMLRVSPGLSVLVVSSLTQRNAEISLRCLAMGAVDYLPKPRSARDLTLSTTFQDELRIKLQGIAACHRRERPGIVPYRRPFPVVRHAPPRVLIVGASTGGPRAVAQVVTGLASFAAQIPILVVQHMPPIFTTVFARQLAQASGIAVEEGRHDERVVPGRVYVAPGGRHMGLGLVAGHPAIRLDDGPPVHHCRPALDILLGDATTIYGSGTLLVVLTGMGQDGLDGARGLAAAHATIIVQDEASSVVWGMPGSIAKAGLAHQILPVGEIARAIGALMGVAAPSRHVNAAG